MSNETPTNQMQALEKLALLNEIGRIAIASSDLDKLFQEAAQLVKERLGVQYVMIGIIDYPNEAIVTRATAGIDSSVVSEHEGQGIHEGIIGQAVETAKTVVINDVAQDPRYVRGIPTTQSEMCVPLKVLDAVVGFLNLESDRQAAFEQADVEILEAAGSFLGQAIRNSQLREELEDSKNYLESLIQNAGDAIITFDRQGRIRTWNKAAEIILGRTREEVLQRDALELLQGSPEHIQHIYELVLSGQVVRNLQMRYKAQDGILRTLDLSVAPVIDGQGEVNGISCILRDMTEEIRADFELKRRLQTEHLLNDVSKEMTAILELDELLNRVGILLRRVIEYEILGIFLYRPETNSMELKVAIGYSPETVERAQGLKVGEGILGNAALERRTILSTDLASDPRAIPARTLDGRLTRAEVAIPIISKDKLLGGLVVESCDPDYFVPQHVRVLETLAGQLAVSIENAGLFQELRAKEQKLEADFSLARDLQASMLPVTMPEIAGFEVAAMYKPAESLGGDYYDFIWLEEGLVGLAIGDVSGKGVAAAMTMAATRSALRFATRINSSASQVLYHVNRRLFRDVKKRTFITLFYGILDLKDRMFRWSNAGHHPPILLRADGTGEDLSKGGTVLALFDRSRYSSSQTQLHPGDLLCFYTDGVIEAWNKAEEEFGKERLLAILKRKADQGPKEILRTLTGELKKFASGSEQHDDMTLFILKAKTM